MPSTYSNLKIQLMATGENTGTWGNVTNDNLGTALEQAIVETATVTFASANVTLTLTDTNAKQDARALRLNLTGTTAGARDLIVPAIQKPYLVNNGTADTITVKVSGQTGIAVPAGKSMLLYNNGTDVGLAFNRVVADVVGNLTGTASNATVLQTARNIQISGNVTAANVSFDGSAAVNLSVTAINASGITSGTLAVGQGGTGATTLNSEAVIIGNTTGAVKFVAPGTSGNVLTSNGTAWASQAIAAGGDYVMQVYTGPTTWTKPASVKAIKVTVLGGGGGGNGVGSVNPGNNTIASSGGGGGGVAIEYIDAPAIPGPVSVTVGSGGSAGPGNPGTPPQEGTSAGGGGGTSSFGAFLSATGGAGASFNPTPLPASGDRRGISGVGGAGSGGQINTLGTSINYNLNSGVPLGSIRTSGGVNILFTAEGGLNAIGTDTGGGAVANSGCGGGGGSISNSSTQRAGGAGAAGLVIVEEFY